MEGYHFGGKDIMVGSTIVSPIIVIPSLYIKLYYSEFYYSGPVSVAEVLIDLRG